jgi:hypothetical protein
VTSFYELAVPAQNGVWLDEQPQPAQRPAGQRGQQRGEGGPVLGCELRLVRAELSFKDGDLMAQGKDLDVFVSVTDRPQSQHCESVGDGEVGQTQQHE